MKTMKYYKKCEGCGLNLQSSNEKKEAYVPNEDFNLCMKCFRSKNYGEFSNNLTDFYDVGEIKEIKNDNVIMIIDVLNPYETLIHNINDYVKRENLIVLINKVDVLPKSIKNESILSWIDEIAESKNIDFKYASLVSSLKKINIDTISNFILESDRETSIVGYSNVGKSSIIKSLFNSVGLNINNLITNSIGTTKEIIELTYKNKKIKDYPGIILKGSYQNILSREELKETSPLKEILIKNYQLSNHQTISIGDYAFFHILSSENVNGYQFMFSNLVKLHRGKYKNKEHMESYEINHKKGNRYDLIISGLGIITFKSNGQKLILQLPKDIKFNLVRSLYE